MRTISLCLTVTIGMLALHGGNHILSQESKSKQEKTPLPSGPPIKDLAATYSYSIRFEYAGAGSTNTNNSANKMNSAVGGGEAPQKIAKPADPYVQSSKRPDLITITRTDPYLSLRFSNSSGNELVGYFLLNKYIFLQTAREKNPTRISLPQRDPLPPPLTIGEEILLMASENKYYGFDWVSPKTYVAVETINNTPCFVFEKEGVKAWIDQQQRRPIQWKSPDETRYYLYQKPAPNHIPEAVMVRIKGLKQDIERFTKSPKGG